MLILWSGLAPAAPEERVAAGGSIAEYEPRLSIPWVGRQQAV